jgi:hypothetical protein
MRSSSIGLSSAPSTGVAPAAARPSAASQVKRRSMGAALAGGVTLSLAALVLTTLAEPRLLTAASPAQATASPTGQASGCDLSVDKVARPQTVTLGSDVMITLTVAPRCSAVPLPLHIVLVLDGSAMDASLSDDMKQHATDIVDALDLNENPMIKVGIVEYNESADTRCQLTNDQSRAKTCIGRVSNTGASQLELGIDEAISVLARGRSDVDDPREVMVLFQQGANSSGCPPVTQRSNQVKSQGVLVIGQCVGPDCDTTCLRQASSSPRYFFEWDSKANLLGLFGRLINDMALPVTLTVTDTLPANMALVAGSPSGSPVVTDGRIVWTYPRAPIEPAYTMTLHVTPLETGTHPTNVEAEAHLTMGASEWRVSFPVPSVHVVGAQTPTATETSVTPTSTSTATPSTAEPTVTPTATRGESLWALYIPTVKNR